MNKPVKINIINEQYDVGEVVDGVVIDTTMPEPIADESNTPNGREVFIPPSAE